MKSKVEEKEDEKVKEKTVKSNKRKGKKKRWQGEEVNNKKGKGRNRKR